MSDDQKPESESGKGAAPQPPEPETPSSSPAAEKVGDWFKEFALYPFFIVLGIVGVFTLFSFLMRENKTEIDYLRQIRTSGGNDRWYAAFQLSNYLSRKSEDLRDDPVFLSEVRRIFEETAEDDPRVQRYLAIVLGRVGDASTQDVLIQALAEDDDVETRMWSAWSLGSIGATGAVPPLVAALDDADAAVRKMAAYALGSLRDPRGIAPLEARLQDEVEDVRWNAAIALAQSGVGTGYPVLRQMVNSLHLSRIEGMTDERVKDIMLNAVKALGILQATFPSARDLLEETSETAPFPLVQHEARKQLEESGAGS